MARQRRGIPQLAHPHTLAMGGLEAMEALLPGFKEEVSRARLTCAWRRVAPAGSVLVLCAPRMAQPHRRRLAGSLPR